jgi:hypothetical protein
MYKLKEAAASYHEETEAHKKLLVYNDYLTQMDVTTKEAVAELWELFGWLFGKLLGSIHRVGYLSIYVIESSSDISIIYQNHYCYFYY